jgi:hypothetical protein
VDAGLFGSVGHGRAAGQGADDGELLSREYEIIHSNHVLVSA